MCDSVVVRTLRIEARKMLCQKRTVKKSTKAYVRVKARDTLGNERGTDDQR